jgi:hypothetical protein
MGIAIIFIFTVLFCSPAVIQPGENRLTIKLKSGEEMLEAQAKVYLNEKFIGMTGTKGDLEIKLKKGEYAIRIVLEGYIPWEETILMVGQGYSQTVYPLMKKL